MLDVTYSTIATLLVAIDIFKHRHEVLIGVPGNTLSPIDDPEHA